MTTPTKPQAGERTRIDCPECGRHMEVGPDGIAGDYYAQCRNRKCSFDGWSADSLWAPPIKLTFEQRDQARRLEEWIVDHAEEAAFEIIHLRNLLAKQQEAQP